jgi:hypothetical protein
MKTIVIVGLALIASAPAVAGSTCYTVGSQTYCNGTGQNAGASSSGYSIGNNQYYSGRDANGRNWSQSCYFVGTVRYCN